MRCGWVYGGETSGSRIRNLVCRRWLALCRLFSVVPTSSAAVLATPVVVVGAVVCVSQSVGVGVGPVRSSVGVAVFGFVAMLVGWGPAPVVSVVCDVLFLW